MRAADERLANSRPGPDAVRLRLLSVRPSGSALRLYSVTLDAWPSAEPSVEQPPSSAALLGASGGGAALAALFGAMAAGMRPGAPLQPLPQLGNAPRAPPAELLHALRGTAGAVTAPPDGDVDATRSSAAPPCRDTLVAAVSSLEARLGAPPPAEVDAGAVTLAALAARVSRLEASLDAAVADFGARIAALERGSRTRSDD